MRAIPEGRHPAQPSSRPARRSACARSLAPLANAQQNLAFLPPHPNGVRIAGWRGVFTRLQYLILKSSFPISIIGHSFISRPLLCFTYEAPTLPNTALARPKNCPKTATYRSLRCSNSQPLCHRQARIRSENRRWLRIAGALGSRNLHVRAPSAAYQSFK